MHQIRFFSLAKLNVVTALTSVLAVAKRATTITGFLLLCLTLLSGSLPAQAANPMTPQLEQQVLEIIREHPEVILESVQAYQQQKQQQLQQRQQAFLQQLQTNPRQVIAQSPITEVAQPKILLMEFSDFQCPYCSQAHNTLKELMAKYRDDIALVYKHFPLTPVHPEAVPAAKAAWAALQQGKFWEYQDALFTQQNQLGEELYVAIAQNLNLDMETFNRDRTSEAANTAIRQDTQLAENLGLAGTPFFIVSSETFSGAVQLSDLENLLSSL